MYGYGFSSRYSMYGCRSNSLEDEAASFDLTASGKPPVAYPCKTTPVEQARFVPLRLSMKQRKSQRLIRAITLASCYTDKVDLDFAQPVKRDLAIVKEVLNSFRGFIFSLDLKRGATLMTEGDFTPFKMEVISAIEVTRRYKIMNPDLLRMDYVKFLYWIQDAVFSEGVRDQLGFNITTDILTVENRLKQLGADALLTDPRLPLCITPVPKIAQMKQLNLALRYKDKLVNQVCREYAAKAGASSDDVEICIRSLNDSNNFDDNNEDSIHELLKLFLRFFRENETSATSLSIKEGEGGSRLTHEHAKQFNYVSQTLVFWKNVTADMFRLWNLAETDMLDVENPYSFRETGQGKQRVQAAPRLYTAVKEILEKSKKELGKWVGSERIHMGDNQVPNAFFFIEKYGQISRIVVPILRTISFIDDRCANDSEDDDDQEEEDAANECCPPKTQASAAAGGGGGGVKKNQNQNQNNNNNNNKKVDENRRDRVAFRSYIQENFGSAKKAQQCILRDFFRHGFDGSGGDNFEDAGDCVDGRLSSCFEWCNRIHDKAYFPIFMLAGFASFEGDLTL